MCQSAVEKAEEIRWLVEVLPCKEEERQEAKTSRASQFVLRAIALTEEFCQGSLFGISRASIAASIVGTAVLLVCAGGMQDHQAWQQIGVTLRDALSANGGHLHPRLILEVLGSLAPAQPTSFMTG